MKYNSIFSLSIFGFLLFLSFGISQADDMKKGANIVQWRHTDSGYSSELVRYVDMNEYMPNTIQYRTRCQLPAVIEKTMRDAEKRHNLPLARIIDNAAKNQNLNPALVHAVVYQESRYNPRAKSHEGAKGLMLLMPGTARAVHVTDPFNARQNVDGGTRWLRRMLDMKGIDGNVSLALAAYNAGPGNVQKAGFRIPKFKETQNYIKEIMGHYRQSSCR